jgi:chromosome segregation ATPase
LSLSAQLLRGQTTKIYPSTLKTTALPKVSSSQLTYIVALGHATEIMEDVINDELIRLDAEIEGYSELLPEGSTMLEKLEGIDEDFLEKLAKAAIKQLKRALKLVYRRQEQYKTDLDRKTTLHNQEIDEFWRAESELRSRLENLDDEEDELDSSDDSDDDSVNLTLAHLDRVMGFK